MEEGRKRVTISVFADEFESDLARRFTASARCYEVPRGKLLARGLYLAMLELEGSWAMEEYMDELREDAAKNNQPFDEDLLLNREEWRALFDLIPIRN